MWRFRNVLQIFVVFFLWSAVFTNPETVVFGYDKSKILTYVFGILVLRALVLSSRTVDVAQEISSGNITNYLLKPINYFKFWFTRDISSKALNISFAIVEIVILFFILKPPLFIQTNPMILLSFFISIILAILLFFLLLFITNLINFWMPEAGWPVQFLFVVIIMEFLSGGVFPIDILPILIQKVLYVLPFPYLLFFPLQVYLGKIDLMESFQGIVIASSWVVFLWWALNQTWQKGIKHYSAEGR